MLGIKIPFSVEGKHYRRGLDGLKKDTKKWGNSIKGSIAGAFAIGAITKVFGDFFEKIREVNKAAKLLNVSFDEMKKIKGVSQEFNTDLEDTKELLSNVNERIFEASVSAGHMKAEWDALGTSADALRDKTPIEQMASLSDAFKTAEDRGAALAAGIALFGDDFKRTIEVMNAGGDAIRGVADEVNKTPRAITEFVKKWDKLWRKSGVILMEFLGMTIQILQTLVSVVLNTGGLIGDIISNVFSGISDGAIGLFKILSGAATLDLSKIKEGAEQMGRGVETIFSKTANDAVKAYQTASKEIVSTWKHMHKDIEKADIDAARKRKILREKELEEEKKRVKEMAEFVKQLKNEHAEKYQEALAFFDEKRFKELSPIEQIKELQDEYAKLFAKGSTTSLFEGADFLKQAEEVKEKIKQIEKELSDEALKKQEELNAKVKADKKAEEDKEKVKIAENQSPSAGGVIASSLAQIGGGGGVFVGKQDPALDEARKQSATLNSIEQGIAMLNRTMTAKTTTPTTFKK